jgi:hypothetical protein
MALTALVTSSLCALAVTDQVRQACKADYYQHCSQFSVGTEELRQCMRKVGEGLSSPCLVALVQAGEITKADVERHNAQKAGPAKTSNIKTGTKEPDVAKKKHKKENVKLEKKKPGKSSKTVAAKESDNNDTPHAAKTSTKKKADKKGKRTHKTKHAKSHDSAKTDSTKKAVAKSTKHGAKGKAGKKATLEKTPGATKAGKNSRKKKPKKADADGKS